MDPFYVISQIKELLHSDKDYYECCEQVQNLCSQEGFYRGMKYILFGTNDFSIPDKLSTLCFMKQFGIFFNDQQDFISILPFLDNPDLNYMASQLIVLHSDNFKDLYDLLIFLKEQLKPSDYVILLNSYIQIYKIIESEFFECVIEIVSMLYTFLKNENNTLEENLSIIKCIVLISKSIDNEEAKIHIYQILFEIFLSIEISIENEPLFFEILQLRTFLIDFDRPSFYQKVKELSEFIVIDRGPPIGLNQSSLNYYLSDIIFHSLENYENEEEENPFLEKKEDLILTLFLFSVYSEYEVEQWLDDVEEFFTSNSKYLTNNDDRNGSESEIDENTFIKDSNDLHEFIYSQIIKLGDFHFDENTTLITLVISLCEKIIFKEFEKYSNSLINLNVIFISMNLIEFDVDFDVQKYLENSDDVSFVFLILYLSMKNIDLSFDLNEQIELFLGNESQMFKILIASILTNYNNESINPEFYINCFCQCLEITESFNTEKVTDLIKMLSKLADFENKPSIVPVFADQMQGIMESLIDELAMYQSAYLSTESLCDLITHFIRFIEFQEQLLPFFLTFIDNLCLDSRSAVLGIKLILSFLKSKTSPAAFTKELMFKFYSIFHEYLQYFDVTYLNDNPDLISTIISILTFFVNNSLFELADLWTFEYFQKVEIESVYFDNIAPLVVSLVKSGESVYCVDILKMLVHRSELFNPVINVDDPIENPEGKIEKPLINQSVLTLAHLGVDNKESFVLVLSKCKFNLSDVLYAIDCHFFVDLNIADDRLILVLFLKFEDEQIPFVSLSHGDDDDDDDFENLIFAIQLKSIFFFEKVIDNFQRNGLNGLFKSEFFDSNDEVFDDYWMKCPFSELAEKLLKDKNSGNDEIEKKKEIIFDFFEQSGI